VALKLPFVEAWLPRPTASRGAAYTQYSEHIYCWNGGKEPSRWGAWSLQGKRSTKDFIDSFKTVLQSIQAEGFNSKFGLPIATMPDGDWRGPVIMQGAHRLAAAVAMRLPRVPVKFLDIPKEQVATRDWGQAHFQARQKMCGLPRSRIEAALYSVLGYKTNLLVLQVWPRVADRISDEQVYELARQHHVNVWYRKRVWLTNQGIHTYVQHAYGTSSAVQWIGNKVKYVRSKERQVVTAFWLEGASLNNVTRVREALRRSVSKQGSPEWKHTAHLSDNAEQARLLSQLLLFNESLHWLNRSRTHSEWALLGGMLVRGLGNLSRPSVLPGVWLHPEDLLVDGGTVLRNYGIRHTDDVDVVFDRRLSAHYETAVRNSRPFTVMLLQAPTTGPSFLSMISCGTTAILASALASSSHLWHPCAK